MQINLGRHIYLDGQRKNQAVVKHLEDRWDDQCPFEFDNGQINDIQSHGFQDCGPGIVFHANQPGTKSNFLYINKDGLLNDEIFSSFKKNEINIKASWRILNLVYFVVQDDAGGLKFYKLQNGLQPLLILEVYDGPLFDTFYGCTQQHSLLQFKKGFFNNHLEYIYLVSYLTLKPFYFFRKNGFDKIKKSIKSKEKITNLVAMENFLLFEVYKGMQTIMTQFNGKMMRKIQGYDTRQYDQYSKFLFEHFLIILCQWSKYYNKLDIYDLRKGGFIAEKLYEYYKGLLPIGIRDGYLIMNDKKYKIKSEYQHY